MGGEAELQLAAKTDVQTYELYLRARQLMNKRDLESLELAKQLLGEAIGGDPSYAPAYAQLGIATILTSDRNYGVTPQQEALAEALPILQKAVSLDSELAEGWAGLGLYYSQVRGSLDQSIELLHKSLALNPNLIDASNWLQGTYRTEGKITESIQLLEQILERDPLYRPAISNLSFGYILTNRTDQSLALIERSKRYLPNDPRMVAAEAAHYLLSQQPVQAYPLVEKLFRSMPSDPGARTVFSIALMQLGDHGRLAEIGFGWPKCVGLTRLKRVEEAAMVCSDVAADDLGEGLNKLFDFLVNSGREQELIRFVQDRWGDLDAFENDVLNRDGFAHQTMGHIARAYQLLGDEGKYSDALQRFRASLDFQRANGADSFLMEWAEGYYFALAGDFDAALTHLERASTFGFKFDLETSAYWPVYKPLDGVPRFEALKADGQRRINAEREQVGLEPLSS
jgi:tetratricopeptide (TPR) repeat protein